MSLAKALRLHRQARLVLGHLESGQRLTQPDALKQYGIMRLTSRVYDLKRAGIDVAREFVPGPNGAPIAEYRLPA